MVSGKSLPTSPFRKGLAPALSSRVDPVAKGLPKNMPFLGSLHPVMEGAGPGQEPFQLNMGCACPRPPRGWSNASQIFLTVLMSFCPILLQPLTFHRCLSQKKKKKDSLHTQIHLCICFQRSQPTTVPPGAVPESTSVTRDLGATSRVTDRR